MFLISKHIELSSPRTRGPRLCSGWVPAFAGMTAQAETTKNTRVTFRILLLLLFTVLLTACAPSPPQHTSNVCSIFKEYPKWYYYAKQSEKKWGVPVSVQMAIMYQESSFNAGAKPGRTKLLWVIPWKRKSSAYGYSQALKQTWEKYKASTGNDGAKRNDFADATDFIGWYGYQVHKQLGIRRDDAYNLYLAYHEGNGGYKNKTYRNKPWLINVANQVQSRARTYQYQLYRCEGSIEKHWYWKLGL